MTDLVKVAIISTSPGLLAAILGFINRSGIGTVNTKVADVETKVDGRLTELLALTKKSSHAEGVKDELDRDK